MNGWCIGNMVLFGLNQGEFLSGKTGPAAWGRSLIFLGTGCLPTLPQVHYWPACWVTLWFPEGTLPLNSQGLEASSEAPQCTLPRASSTSLSPQSDALHSILPLAFPSSCFTETPCSLHVTHLNDLETSQSCSFVKDASCSNVLFVYFQSHGVLGHLSYLFLRLCW